MLDTKYKKYQELIVVHKERERKELIRFNELNADLEDVLSVYRSDEGKTMVTYKSLSNLEYHKWYDIGAGVRFKRVKNRRGNLIFITEMNPEQTDENMAVLGRQKHDCKEYCIILEGELIEEDEGGKRYEAGDVVVYPANYIHKPKSSVISRYEVEFIKPNYEKNSQTIN